MINAYQGNVRIPTAVTPTHVGDRELGSVYVFFL